MKNKIAIVLIVAIMCLTQGFVFATDYADATDEESIAFLEKLKIISSDDWHGISMANGVTRAEAAVIFNSIAQTLSNCKIKGAVFSDIPANHKEAQAILNMTTYRIMNSENGYFLPQQPLTLMEMIDSCAELLGYKSYAEKVGIGSENYYRLPDMKNLYKHIDNYKNHILTKNEFAIILKNALDTEILETPISIRPQKKVSSGITMLEYYMGIRQIRGKVTANKYTALPGFVTVGKEYVRIDQLEYIEGDSKAGLYIGMFVDALVKVTNDENKIVACYPYKNNVIKIESENLILHDNSFSLKKIVYENERGKKEYQNLSGQCIYIYNNAVYDGLKASDLKNINGSLTLIDSDRDSYVDVMLIFDYENYIVDSVDVAKNIIYDKTGKSITVGDNYRITEYFGPDGRVFRMSQLKQWHIVSVCRSKGDDYLGLYLSVDGISGVITKTETIADGRCSIEITDTDGNITELVSDMELEKYIPKQNDEGMFYVNYFGKYVAGDFKPVVTHYAFVIAVGRDSTIDDEIKFNLVLDDGSTKICTVRNGIVLNKGTKTQTPKLYGDDIINCFNEQQLIQVKLNSNDEILILNKADTPDNSFGFDDTRFTYDGSITSEYYYQSQLSFGYDYGLSSTSFVFLLDNGDGDEKFSTDDVTVVTRKNLSEVKYRQIKFYDTDAVKCARAVVAYTGEGKRQTKFAVYDKTTFRLNSDGESQKYITYLIDGVSTEVPVAIHSTLPELKKGDLMFVFKDYSGEITNVELLKKSLSSTQSINLSSGSMKSTELGVYRSKLMAKSSERISLWYENALITIPFASSCYTYIITSDNNNTTLEVGSPSKLNASLDLSIADEVYVLVKYNIVYGIAVYHTI